jgi:NAD(P)-dependent dehydrogenase (short-subunit alcohol dehydrogenase family)
MDHEQLFSVRGKRIAIIGAAGLLGSQYVRLFSSRGAQLALGDIDLARCEGLAEEAARDGVRVLWRHVDTRDAESIAGFFDEVRAEYSGLDVLINNAQMKPDGFYASFEDYRKDALMAVLDANLAGVVISCQHACVDFLRQGHGNIINVSSVYGHVGADQRLYAGVRNPYFPDRPFSSPVSYAVSKAGIESLTRYLASYYRGRNIRVNCLIPGGVFDNHDKNFVENYSYRTLLGRMAEKNEYNGAILFLASDASSYMTGANLIVDGGWTAI